MSETLAALPDEVEAALRDIETLLHSGPARVLREYIDLARLAARGVRVEDEGLRGWQRDLLAFDADGLSLDQVVADLLGVKSVNLRTAQDDDGTPTSDDRRWRVQFFGGTYGGTLRETLAALAATPTPPETLFSESEAPTSLLALADEWCDRTAPDDVARLNVRGFAVWADLRRKATKP